jgi:hypothetical protein
MAQGRLRVVAMKPQQCPSKTAHTLGSMQQHLFTLQMHTYKVQEGVTTHSQSPRRALQQVRLCAPQGSSTKSSFGLRMLGAQSAQEGELLHSKTSLTQERATLARRSACRRESLDASICCW